VRSRYPRLVGLYEFAKLAGVTPQAVSNWRNRYEDFPVPVAELRMSPIWTESQVRKWIRLHESRRSRSRYD